MYGGVPPEGSILIEPLSSPSHEISVSDPVSSKFSKTIGLLESYVRQSAAIFFITKL